MPYFLFNFYVKRRWKSPRGWGAPKNELLVLPGHLFLEIDVLLMKYAKSRAGDGMSIGIPGISNNPEA